MIIEVGERRVHYARKLDYKWRASAAGAQGQDKDRDHYHYTTNNDEEGYLRR